MSLVPAQIDQGKVLQALGLNVNDPKAQATLLICERYELDPFLGHMQLVQNKPYVTRDGYLHIAHRSRQFDGMEVVDEGEEATYYWCKVAVYRKDMRRPFVAVGRVKKNEKTQADPWDMALTRAERRALRRAFNVASFVESYEPEEFADYDAPAAATPELAPASEEPFEVETAPAGPTSVKQATERKTLAQQAQDLKAKDPVSQIEYEELIERARGLDTEHSDLFKARLKQAKLTLSKPPSRGDSRRIDELLSDVATAQAGAWEERRKTVMAEGLGGLDEDARHALVLAATANVDPVDGGPTESVKHLTEQQTHAILDWLENHPPAQQQTLEAS